MCPYGGIQPLGKLRRQSVHMIYAGSWNPVRASVASCVQVDQEGGYVLLYFFLILYLISLISFYEGDPVSSPPIYGGCLEEAGVRVPFAEQVYS